MGRIFCLLVVLAISGFAVSSASAAEYPIGLPEVGKCTKVGAGKGTYTGPNCIKVGSPKSAAYEWTPVKVTDNATFSGGGAETTIASQGHGAIKCIGANFSGKYQDGKVATVTVAFTGCVNSENAQCQSGNTKTLIETLPLEAEYGFIKNEVVNGQVRVQVGLDLKPTPPLTAIATYECGGGPTESNTIEGSVIGKATPINKMSTPLNFLYFVRKSTGEQVPEHFQEMPNDTLTTTFKKGLESSSAPTTLNISEYAGNNSVPLEIKAKEL